jgi:XTP/dITP diphosphohydrolase
VERAIAATRRGDTVPEELDVAQLGEVSEEEWREHWPPDGSAIDRGPAAGPTATAPVDEDAGEAEAVSKASGGGSKRRKGRK